MLKPFYLLFCLLLLLPHTVAAKAPQLTVSPAFNILAVNGTSYPSGLLDQDRQLTLRAGINRIAIVYEEVFESETDDDFDIVKSAPFLLSIYLNADHRYQQRMAKPANAIAGRQFAKRPLIEIVDTTKANQKRVEFQLSALAGDNQSYLMAQTRITKPSPLILSSNPASQAKPALSTTSANNSTASRMLDYWWQQATEAERKAFLNKIKQQ